MAKIQHVRQGVGRVTYPVNYCQQSFQAMKTIQERLDNAGGITFSLSVIARALGLMTVQGIPTTDAQELLAFCKRCASRSKNRGKRSNADA
tara:strand:+ start:3155 stop:3427 length:273 start_codon:yes stop_codon:yes gene_type:complete